MKALIDTCVIVDVLQKREPFYNAAMDVVLTISNQQCQGILTAKSLTDIYYILRRSIHEEAVRKVLHVLFTLFDVEDTLSVDCQLAMSSPMKDYEDAVMVQTAVRIGADCIITRNLKDYKLAEFPVLLPEEFLNHIKNSEKNHG